MDDILFIFHGTVDELEAFSAHLNSRKHTIKLSLQYSRKSVSFLDVLAKRTEHLATNVYRRHG